MSSLCTALICYNPREANFNYAVGSALEGTQCGVGKVCLGYNCTESKELSSNQTECLFEDEGILNGTLQGVNLPNAWMSCDGYLTYYYNNYQFDTFSCSNAYIKNRCCTACKGN